jgi:NAD(P)-dependent dehydrogenase (short-subunit alcohol dehydrogenase family)
MKLAGKVALVTGSARGIGREIALRFAQEGARVAVADLDAAGAEQLASICGEAKAFEVDISDAGRVASMLEGVEREFGRLDILVNNAGIGLTRPFLDTTLDEWSRTLLVNLTGTFLCSQGAARIMRKQGSGKIINIGSISGGRGGVGRAAYGASKAGIIYLTKAMAVELASYGIQVNCISPGPTETEQVRQWHDTATRQAYHALLPMKRYAHPREIAAAVLFLASDDSSFITGHNLHVDGGFSAAGLMVSSEA